jgi:DNA-binding phage protein
MASKVKALKVDFVDLDSFDEYKSSIDLNNKRKLIKLLTQMFIAGDHDSFMELMELYIDHVGKRKISKEANIPEKTIYNFKDKKHKTSSENIFKMMKAISEKGKHSKAS